MERKFAKIKIVFQTCESDFKVKIIQTTMYVDEVLENISDWLYDSKIKFLELHSKEMTNDQEEILQTYSLMFNKDKIINIEVYE